MSSSLLRARQKATETDSSITQRLRTAECASHLLSIPTDLTSADLVALLRTELRRSYESGRPIALEDYVAIVDRVASRDDWITLLVVDIELRQEFGPELTPAEYVKRFPLLNQSIPEAFNRANAPIEIERSNRSQSKLVGGLSLFSSDHSGIATRRRKPIPQVAPTGHEVSVPGYEILGVLGRGGMGIVYKARQVGLNRLVALKMILAGMHADEEDLARFRQEAEAVATLRHPGVVQVYEIGEHAGTPYYSMEYIDGGTLAKKLAGKPQSPAFAAAIAESMARAIHAAHQQNLVHRDLKPANVLLPENPNPSTAIHLDDKQTPSEVGDTIKLNPDALNCERPTAFNELFPKITDFGLAKRLDANLHLTTTGLVAGTPQYMAPEQVSNGRRHRVGPTADIYSIGVILYEMLTGRPPFLGSSPAEIMHQVISQEPVAIRQLQPRTPRDLETICLKCLQKESGKRYPTADDLAEDLRRFRAGEPILARPIGRLGQAVRWCRRNPAVAGLLLAVIATLVGGTAIASLFAVDADRHARVAEQKEREARQLEAAALKTADELRDEKLAVEKTHSLLSNAHRDLTAALKQVEAASREEQRLKRKAQDQEKQRARELFDAQMLQAQRAWDAGQVARTRRLLAAYEPARHDQTDLRGFEWHYLDRLSNADGIRFNIPDGCRGVAVSPDGKRIIWPFHKVCEVWALGGGNTTRITVLGTDAREGHSAIVERAAYDPAGKLIATAARDKTVKIWDASGFRLLHTLDLGKHAPMNVAFSPAGDIVAAVTRDDNRWAHNGDLRVWNARTGELQWMVEEHVNGFYDLAFSPDGKQIATAGPDDSVRIWDVVTGKLAAILELPKGTPARSVAFAPKGNLIAAGTLRGEIVIWNAQTGAEQRRLHGHLNWVRSIAFSSDGTMLASAGGDQLLRIWDARTGEERRTYRGHTQPLTDVTWLPDRNWVFTSGLDQSIKGWNINHDPEHFLINSHWGDVAQMQLLPNGRDLAVAGSSGFVGLWNSRNGQSIATADFRRDGRCYVPDSSLNPDGNLLAFIRVDVDQAHAADVRIWNRASDKTQSLELRSLAKGVRRVAHSSDGTRLATGHLDGVVQVHRLDRKAEPLTWKIPGRTVSEAIFPPGRTDRLLVLGPETSPQLFELDGLNPRQVFVGHKIAPHVAAFSADGKRLATGSNDQTAIIWDVETGQLLFRMEGHTGPIRCLAFSPDGQRLVTGGDDYCLKLWDTGTGQETLSLRGHTREVTQAFFSPDGCRIISTSLDRTVRVWDAGHHSRREQYRAVAAACRLSSFEIDGARSSDASIQVRYELANVSGKSWPISPTLGKAPYRTHLRLFAELIEEGQPSSKKIQLIGKHDFLPNQSLAADQRVTGEFTASLQGLPPGRYRLRLEHGWHGDEIIPISEKAIEVTVLPEMKTGN